jgi:hypothetical protein
MKLPKNAQLWLPGYLQSRWWAWRNPKPARCRVWLLLADHYEPLFQRPTPEVARERVAAWTRAWPQIASRHRDSAGRAPVYTFFFPQEEYRPEFLDPLARMTSDGIADVEVHIHHDCEGEQDFLDRMHGFIEVLTARHGLLRSQNGKTVFAFIHGNWALDNSRRDGRYCGLNNEITLLRDMGCYADFSMPAGTDSDAQSRTVNTIMWATDDPERPKSYDNGVAVRPGHPGQGDLLMIPGPMGFRYGERLVPRIESGELAHQDLPTPYRVSRWLDLAPRLGPDIFLKLHAHGANDLNLRAMLAPGGLDRLFELLAAECARRGYEWYSVSAWQMRQAVDAAARQLNPAPSLFSPQVIKAP